MSKTLSSLPSTASISTIAESPLGALSLCEKLMKRRHETLSKSNYRLRWNDGWSWLYRIQATMYYPTVLRDELETVFIATIFAKVRPSTRIGLSPTMDAVSAICEATCTNVERIVWIA